MRPSRHHHEARRAADDLIHDAALPGSRALEHRVQGRDHGQARALQKVQEEGSIGTTEDAVLVLHRQHVGVGIGQEVSCALVCTGICVGDIQADLRRILLGPRTVRHGQGEALYLGRGSSNCSAKGAGEGGNAA